MKNLILLLNFLVLALVSAPAHPADSGLSAQANEDAMVDSQWKHHRSMPLVVTLSGRYYSMNTSGYSSAFTGAALAAPKSGSVGMDFSVYWETQNQWQIGFGFGGASNGSSSGATSGTYQSNIFGVWIGKEYRLADDNFLSFGALLGYGDSTAQIITTGISGSTEETCFTFEPKITASHLITSWLRIGLSASYLEPLAQNQDIKGNNLTPGNISLHSLSGGLEFMIGRWGSSTQSLHQNQ